MTNGHLLTGVSDSHTHECASRLIRFKVQQTCQRRGISKSEEEVLEHDLRTHLALRMARYDPSRGKVTTFIDRVIERWLISYLRHRFADKRDPRREECGLNEPVLDADGRVVPRHETTPEAASDPVRLRDLERDVAHVVAHLPDDLRAIALALAFGTQNSVGPELGFSRRATTNAIDQLREIFRDAGLGEYLS